jgi:hypothetical protein
LVISDKTKRLLTKKYELAAIRYLFWATGCSLLAAGECGPIMLVPVILAAPFILLFVHVMKQQGK